MRELINTEDGWIVADTPAPACTYDSTTEPARQRQDTPRPWYYIRQGKHLSTSQARQWGAKKGITPQAGGGSVIHSKPSIICDFGNTGHQR